MQRMFGVAVVAAVVLAGAGAARADDDADLKAVIAKAIKAHGGADNLAKYKAGVLKIKGKFYGMGAGIDFTGETAFQAPDRFRLEVEVEVMGQNFKSIQVVNGAKGWIALNDQVNPMSKEMLVEVQEQMHAGRLTRLLPLTGKDYKLSPLGEAKVGGRPAVGVRVEHKKYRDISLYFDKEKYLLLKSETRAKDVQGGGDTELTVETLYGDYKKVDGVQVAHKVTVKRDGKLYVESETTEVKMAEKLDDGVFAKP
jgi:outer membrane lipoprotein-sorting protein